MSTLRLILGFYIKMENKGDFRITYLIGKYIDKKKPPSLIYQLIKIERLRHRIVIRRLDRGIDPLLVKHKTAFLLNHGI